MLHVFGYCGVLHVSWHICSVRLSSILCSRMTLIRHSNITTRQHSSHQPALFCHFLASVRCTYSVETTIMWVTWLNFLWIACSVAMCLFHLEHCTEYAEIGQVVYVYGCIFYCLIFRLFSVLRKCSKLSQVIMKQWRSWDHCMLHQMIQKNWLLQR